MSTIASGTTTNTALVSTGNTDGSLVLQTNGTTTAVTISTGQVVTLAQPLSVGSGGVGVATLAANNVLLGNGTSALQVVAPSTSGNVLTSNGTTWASSTPAAAGLAAASQTQAEAATSDTVAITPLSAKWHPGVAKVFLKTSGAATPIIQRQYNVTSITDDGVGVLTVTFDVDFTNDQNAYVANAGPEAIYVTYTQVSEGAVTLKAFDAAGAAADPSSYSLIICGDQS